MLKKCPKMTENDQKSGQKCTKNLILVRKSDGKISVKASKNHSVQCALISSKPHKFLLIFATFYSSNQPSIEPTFETGTKTATKQM